MKPVSSIVRRADGLRVLECRFLTVKNEDKRKECVVESRMVRLHSQGALRSNSRPLSVHEQDLLETWNLLGKATLSHRTYKLLFILLVNTTAAPVRVVESVPALSLSATDIRPWLCDPVAIAALFVQLYRYDSDRSHGHGLCDPLDAGVVYDPWFFFRSGERIPLGEADLAPVVWERAASFTHDVSYAGLKDIDEAYLECLEEEGGGRVGEMSKPTELAEMILGHTKGETGANWIHLFRRVPAGVRVKELKRWVTEYSGVTRCPGELVYLIESACLVASQSHCGLCYLWNGLKAKADVGQLMDGIMLWRKYRGYCAPDVYADGTVDTYTLMRLTDLLVSRDDQDWVARSIWNVMHKHPVLQESFQALLDEPHGHRGWLLRLVREVEYESRDDDLARAFNDDFQKVSEFLLNILPEFREKAVEYFGYVYWDRSSRFSAAKLMEHIATICEPPFTQRTEGKYLWDKLLNKWQADELPLSSWKRIDQACRSDNQANALDDGLARWDRDVFRDILRSGLHFRVRLSLEIIRLTRQSSVALVDRAFAKFEQHPLLDVSLKEPADLETYLHLMGRRKEMVKWQRHLCGERPLRVESAEQLYNQLEGRRVEALLMYFRDELVAPCRAVDGVADGLQLHTRLYAEAADENRRAYRKLIQRYSSGGENGVLFHPSNQLWLRDHPYVRKGVWLAGVRAEIELADGTHVYLELERRFEQVLKMGTLVNSCLALDGCNSHSALANAADVNKQVVMAYGSDDQFLGRQLVGIAEERRLVCFDVYGQQAEKLQPAFAAFDVQLETLMALPVHREGDYQLKPLVCREWYDDDYWSPAGEPDARIIDLQWGGSRGTA